MGFDDVGHVNKKTNFWGLKGDIPVIWLATGLLILYNCNSKLNVHI